MVRVSGSDGDQFGDQIVGEDVEEKIVGDVGETPVLCLSQGAMLFAPSEHAFDELASRLGHAVTLTRCILSLTMLLRRLPVWVRASLLATCGVTLKALAGYVYAPVGMATHYHAS